MMRRLVLLAALLVTSIPMSATPESALVTGVVVDSNGKPVASATILMERRSHIMLETLGDQTRFETIARAVTEQDGRFSFGQVDPTARPKNLTPADVVVKIEPRGTYHVWSSDHKELTVTSVDVTTERGKDGSVPTVTLKITIQ